MRTYTLHAILNSVLRQSCFRLVPKLRWSVKNLLSAENYPDKLKKQLIGSNCHWTPNYLPSFFINSCLLEKLEMPRVELGHSSKNKNKGAREANSKNGEHSIKYKKKKRKKKHNKHGHKRKHSKHHSSKAKLSVSKQVELVLLDLSSDDSDVLIVYDSRNGLNNATAKSISQLVRGKKKPDDTSLSVGIQNLECMLEEGEPNITEKQKQNDGVKEGSSTSVGNWLIQVESKNSDVGIGSSSHTYEKSLLVKTDQDNSGNKSVVSAQASSKNSCQKLVKSKKRVWEKMSENSEDAPFRNREYLMFDILSYNVLCQEIMEEHMDLYTYNNGTALNWDYRSRLLMQEFIQFNSDVLCLQEVQQSHLKSFYQELEKLGYTGLFKQRTGDKKDGVAIYYKKSVFNLIEHTTVEYYQPGVPILNRDNVGLIVKLAPKDKPSEQIIIATTHLLYNPRRHDVKLAQLQILLAEVERFAYKEMDVRTKSPKYWPVIITGDMNMEPCTGGFQLLSGGSFQFEGLSSKTLTSDFFGYTRILGKELIPPYLGITDTCQHINIIKKRLKHLTECSQTDHRAEESLLKIYNSDFRKTSKRSMADEKPDAEDFLKNSHKEFSTGQLSHTLQLCSVYQHDTVPYNKPQVSTFQNGWVLVDYIFYSDDGRSDVTGSSEGNLKLVARYKLFNEQEATIVGPIPNLSSPSDHYPLAAKFALLFQ